MRFFYTLLVLTFTLVATQKDDRHDKLYFLRSTSENSDEALLILKWVRNTDEIYSECSFTSDKDRISEILQKENDYPVETVSVKEMQELLSECNIINDSDNDTNDVDIHKMHGSKSKDATTSDSETTTAGYGGLPVIFPGTKWCGAGDRAKNYDDLGLHQDTDRCCRAHDFCDDLLAPGETRNNLTNTSPFTKLSCKCDNDFYDCLDRVNSVTSNTIGNMYFNILRRECYMKDYPLTDKCKKYRTLLKIKCIEYEKDTSAPKVNRWFSAKRYKKIPFPGPLTVTLPF